MRCSLCPNTSALASGEWANGSCRVPQPHGYPAGRSPRLTPAPSGRTPGRRTGPEPLCGSQCSGAFGARRAQGMEGARRNRPRSRRAAGSTPGPLKHPTPHRASVGLKRVTPTHRTKPPQMQSRNRFWDQTPPCPRFSVETAGCRPGGKGLNARHRSADPASAGGLD